MTPPPPAGSGRRGNGLAAAQWGALVDLDPRLSPTLLDRLAGVGVAAYVEPAGGTADPVGRGVHLPKRPLDRLWVDRQRADEAREVVRAEAAELTLLLAEQEPGANAAGLIQAVPTAAAAVVLTPPELPRPELARPESSGSEPSSSDLPARELPDIGPPGPAARTPADTDAAFRAIIDGWDTAPQGPVPSWPVSEDLDGPTREDAPSTGLDPRPPVVPAPQGGLPGWLEPAALEDEGHFVPPPPPPAPRVQPRTVGAVLCILLGILLAFAPDRPGLAGTTGVGLLGVCLVVGGAGALVWWMRDAPPTDRGPDGAVV